MMKRILAVVLAAVLLACVPGAALAGNSVQAALSKDDIVKPMYTYIITGGCSMNITANGLAQMSAWLDCNPSVTKIRMVQYLQKYDGGWQNVNSWSQYYYSNTADWGKSVYVTRGNYRLVVYYYAYSGTTLLEMLTRTVTDTY